MEHAEAAVRHEFTLAVSPCLGEAEARNWHRPKLPIIEKFKMMIHPPRHKDGAAAKKGPGIRQGDDKHLKLTPADGESSLWEIRVGQEITLILGVICLIV